MSDDVRIAKVYAGGDPEPLPFQPVVASGRTWQRVRLEELRCAPGEEADAWATETTIVLNVGSPFRWELAWADEPATRSCTQPSGGIAIFPAAERHRCRWFDPFHVLALAIHRDLLTDAADAAGTANPDQVRLRREMSCEDPLLRHLTLALREAVEPDQSARPQYGETVAVAIAALLVRRYAATPPSAGPARTFLRASRMRRISEYVQGNLDTPIPLHALAEVAGMSVFHFSRLFKARTGVTPHRYVLQQRIVRAKSLLGDPSLAIADIAARCGFAHQQHFAEAFRRCVGLTPTGYRERNATPAP